MGVPYDYMLGVSGVDYFFLQEDFNCIPQFKVPFMRI